MKTLSWDVGIKNLAYCILETDDNIINNNFKIIKWGVINIDDDSNTVKCSYEIRGNKICPKNAQFAYTNNNTIIGLCKVHNTKYEIKIDEIEEDTNKDNICNEEDCNKKSQFIFTNKKYCKGHHTKERKRKLRELTPKKVSKIKCTRKPLKDMCLKMNIELDKIREFDNINQVLIENQPTFINPTMKTISALLFGYFITRYNKKEIIKNVKVSFISPSNKLKVNKKDSNKKLENAEDKNVYKMTKTLGIKYCKELLNNQLGSGENLCQNIQDNLNILNANKKKDDLCDAFLQAYYYIFCTNGLDLKHQEILDKIFTS
jgi:hypothetical protein